MLVLKVFPDYLVVKQEQHELEEDKFYYDIDFKEKADVLDNIVNEEIQNYYILELGFKSPEEIYLNEETQKDLIKKITYRIFTRRMTAAVMSTLSHYYVFGNDVELQKIIVDKVALGILNLTLTTNTTNIQL
jgi:uncharacterized protein YjaZ